MRDKFSVYHPVINFTFFIGAIAFGMILMHPGFLICSLLLSVLYFLTIKGKQGWKFLCGMIPLLLMLSLLNPLFNTGGEHALFYYGKGRPYTLEAVAYGAALAAMMISVLIWFACYNAVMSSDKFLYLFGKAAPSVTLILTMVLRMVPSYKNKVMQLNSARQCIGKGVNIGSRKEKLDHSVILLSALTGWALEGSVITADSMRSRGYGCGKRTTFSLYRFEKKDKVLLAVMIVLAGIILYCSFHGAVQVSYTPKFSAGDLHNPYVAIALAAYVAFLVIPSVINIWEEIRWRSLKSGM
ncbi:MAG: energy-coupling factor transporter transmembrane component T [Muricoprocola sp.]